MNVQLQMRACAAYQDRQVERLGGHVGGVCELKEHSGNDGTRLTRGHQSGGHSGDLLPTLGQYGGSASDQVPQPAAGVHAEAQRHGFERRLVMKAAEQQIGLLSQPMQGRHEKAEHRRFDRAAGCLSESRHGAAVCGVKRNADMPGGKVGLGCASAIEREFGDRCVADREHAFPNICAHFCVADGCRIAWLWRWMFHAIPLNSSCYKQCRLVRTCFRASVS